MKAGAGKRKGSAFEREVCKALSLWVSHGKRRDIFWRTAMSGGRATISGGDVRQAGDVSAVAAQGHALSDAWFIECKHYKTLKLAEFLLRGRGPLQKFWTAAKKEAAKYRRAPILIVKQNGWPALVVTQPDALLCFVEVELATNRFCSVYLFSDLTATKWVSRHD